MSKFPSNGESWITEGKISLSPKPPLDMLLIKSIYIKSHNKTGVWSGVSSKREADNRTALLISNVTCPLLVVQIKCTALVAMLFLRGRQER